jgi:hypothetical protein
LLAKRVDVVIAFGIRVEGEGAPPKSKASTASPSRAGSSTGAPSATAMQRADELLRTMTVEEKAMQLSSVFPLALFNTEGTNRSQLDALLKNGIGHVSALGLIGHKTPEALAKAVNAIQRYLVTETRLKIPAIFHNEAMSGVVAPHFTAFPTPIALAATWDPEAVAEMADIIRRQMRAVGLLQALAPVMDVARDARWGRVSETYGEEPYLVSAMSVAYTRGLQGDDLTEGVLATAKLYAADTATGVTLPAQQLIGFARADLEPGASKTVSFVVPMSLLAYTGLSGDLIMEPGPVEVSAGSSSSDIRSSATFTVTGKTRSIRGEHHAFLSVATVDSSGTRGN